MRKIPTLFSRDPQTHRVIDEVTPGCEWVLAGEGDATVKWDGTAVSYASGVWWARREVKPGKDDPPSFDCVDEDELTGKRVGWVPIELSSFAKWHADAVKHQPLQESFVDGGTYELVGPKVQGNLYTLDHHELWRHGAYELSKSWNDFELPNDAPFSYLADFLRDFGHEGIVWWHEDGRKAKIKRRDFGYPWGRN